MFGKKNQDGRTIAGLGESLVYTRKFLNSLSDETLRERQESFGSSSWRNFCKSVRMPVLAEHYRFEDQVMQVESQARDAVRRYESGKAIWGIKGF